MFTFGVVDWHSYDFFIFLLFKLNVCACAMARAENSHYSAQHRDYWIKIVIAMHPSISINVVIYRYIFFVALLRYTKTCSARYGQSGTREDGSIIDMYIIYELLIFV